ncbi:tigger transposable element-derived protein 4 [Aplysia californica]|uniref:Tigger transposable element-derived protein 4 n=1 Tax=Aplysia californica TaxID=6500 RepID=A0ABM0JYX6_APLCA|nr:tigger transposable element-derived protein 4 [Aplysia californica]XP_005104808.1 tigger transposable element-derived protein 4 [Aplysia californica]XP_005104809.1 tigger transposable element-derived protein 4 [Aplysia californica]XP_035827316.1 tigger transposable element-derived protein 4 [Aplysia californica]
MAEKRKLNCLTFEKKREILTLVDKKTMSKTDICKQFNIPKSTLSTFIKDRDKINSRSEACQPNRKKQRTVKSDAIEKSLFVWFKQARAMAIPISGPILMAKAEEIGTEMGLDFKSNTGWLDRFKKRYGILYKYKTVCGESAAVKTESLTPVESRTKGLLTLLRDFEPRDIYSADETGLFYRCLPFNTLALKGEKCSDGKAPKNRLTVLVAANMDGSDKLPLLIIGKFDRLRCFKYCKYLPLQYKANKKSWMTAALFESWVRSLDASFKCEGRKIALVVDNCLAHPDIDDLHAVTLMRLPSNTTSVLQPCDQGIIASLKKHYRTIVLRKLIAYTDHGKSADTFEMSILDAMYELKAAWNLVSSATVANCFRLAGFVVGSEQPPDDATPTADINKETPTSPAPTCYGTDDLFEAMAKKFLPPGVSLKDFFSVDDAVETTGQLSTEEICASVNVTDSEEQEQDDSPTPSSIPTVAEAREALQKLREFIQAHDFSQAEQYVNVLGNVSSDIEMVSLKRRKQSSITDFFQKV